VPAFVTLLVLNIVFVPMFNLSGVAGYLFSPLAEATVFALVASTLLKSIFGIVPLWSGHVFMGYDELTDPSPHKMLGAGVAYVPQGSTVFGNLTVYENFEVRAVALKNEKKLSILER
jgi:hypothetical protein